MKPVTPIGLLGPRDAPAPRDSGSHGRPENPIDLDGVGVVVSRVSAHLPTHVLARHSTLQQQIAQATVFSIPLWRMDDFGGSRAMQEAEPGPRTAGAKRPPDKVRDGSTADEPARQRHKPADHSFVPLPKPVRVRQLTWQPDEHPLLSAASLEEARSTVNEQSLESRLARQTAGGFQPLSEELIVLQQHMNSLVNRAAAEVGAAFKQGRIEDALRELQALAASLVLPPGQGGIDLPVTAVFARDAMLDCKPVIRAHLLGACHYFHTYLSPNSRWLRELRHESLVDTHSIRHVINHALNALSDATRRGETLAALWVHASWLAAPWYAAGAEQTRQSETLPLALRGLFQAINTRYEALDSPGDQAAFARDVEWATASAFCSPLLASALASNAHVLIPPLREPLLAALTIVIAKDDRRLFPSEFWSQGATPILGESPRAQPLPQPPEPTAPTPTPSLQVRAQARQPLLRAGHETHARPTTLPLHTPQAVPVPHRTQFTVPAYANELTTQTQPLSTAPREIGARLQFLRANPWRADNGVMRSVRNDILAQSQLHKPGGLRRMLDQLLLVAVQPATDALTLGLGDRAFGVLKHLNETARCCAAGRVMPWRDETAFWDAVVQELGWPEMAPLRRGLLARLEFELAAGHRVPKRFLELLARPEPAPQPRPLQQAQGVVVSPKGDPWQPPNADVVFALALMAQRLAATPTTTTTTTHTTATTTTTTTITSDTTGTTTITTANEAARPAVALLPTFLELEDDDTLSPDDLKYREVRGGLVQGPAAGPPVIVKAPQKYRIELESVFPIRDPRYPQEVHRDYRDDNDRKRCHGTVRVLAVRLMPVPVTTERGVSQVECGQYLASFLGNFKNPLIKEAAELRRRLLDAVLGDLRATMKGEQAPSTQWLEVVELDGAQCDNAVEAQALVGQSGVVPKNYEPQSQPSIANGRIVGIFAGARVISDQDHADYEEAMEHRPGSINHDYGAVIPYKKKWVEYFPYLGGNLAQYLNSTFKLSDQQDKLIVDTENINALFIRVSIDMLTNRGQKRTEPMFVIVQIAPVKQGRQHKLDYGHGYTLTIDPVKVKDEPPHNG